MHQRVFTSSEHCSRSEARKGDQLWKHFETTPQWARRHAHFCVRDVADSRLELAAHHVPNIDDGFGRPMKDPLAWPTVLCRLETLLT